MFAYIPTDWYVSSMPRPTKQSPERGDARVRLLEAATGVIRNKGFTATSVDDLCAAAEVTKGAFFHHFKSKEALGVASAEYWSETTCELFLNAPYHQLADPLARVLGYIDFRRSLMQGDPAEWTCLVGTMAQEVYKSSPPVRDACADSILSHAQTLEADIQALLDAQDQPTEQPSDQPRDWTAGSLARHTQAVLQGAFILAKATNDRFMALESVDHLRRYIALLFADHTFGDKS